MDSGLKSSIKLEARRLGFALTGVCAPARPPHFEAYRRWLDNGFHAEMSYLSDEAARARRADPRLILPECQSIVSLAVFYNPSFDNQPENPTLGQVASYAWGDDYHLVLPKKLKALIAFIEKQVGHPVPNRYYADTGPLLERDIAMQAGLGWVGKNTCLINPALGSYFLLAEILLGIYLEPDEPFREDRCGSCQRCVQACPTNCILPDRTLDARRCISYLTIELKGNIPEELRHKISNHIFGCDICQQVCPWNRFAPQSTEPAFATRPDVSQPNLITELSLTAEAFNAKFKKSPVMRAKRRGYLRNSAVALGNSGAEQTLPALEKALLDSEPLIQEHARWAIAEIKKKL